MNVLRYNVGREPPTRRELRIIREKAEACEREHIGNTGRATCPMCGGTFWSWNLSQVIACPSCNPPARSDPANGKSRLPEHMLGTVRPEPNPRLRDEAARRRASEQSRAYRARRRGR